MIRFFLLHVIIGGLGVLQAMQWYHDYDAAINAAKKENKIIYIIITSESCRWCRKMEATTLEDESVQIRLESRYIPLALTRGKDTYPDSLQATMVPKHYFLTPEAEKIYTVPGYWDVVDFGSILDDVERKFATKYKKQ